MRAPAHCWLLLCLLATSCNSGGGGGGGGLAGGGIGGTGQTVGEISGFGSVFVTGVRWDTTSTDFTVDETPGDQSQLEVGMIVTVSGLPDAGGTTGSAAALEYDETLRGPIATLMPNPDGDQLTLEVLGQTVLVAAGRVTFVDTDFASLATGQVIEVSGLFDAQGRLRASYVRDRGAVSLGTTQVTLRGEVSGFNGSDAFFVGPVSVTFDATGGSTDLSGLPGGVADGVSLEVEGTLVAPTTIAASDLDAAPTLDDDLEHAGLEGYISDFISLADFRVSGQPVDASGASLEPADPSLYGDGVRVEVEGPTVGGVLFAEEMESRTSAVRIHAAIAAAADIDVAGSTVTLLGITITVDATSQLEDDVLGVGDFGLDDLAAGDYLEVRGRIDGQGGVVATRLERRDEDDVVLQGPVDGFTASATAGTVTVLGTTVATGTSTVFEDLTDTPFATALDFYAQLSVGDVVKIRDDQDTDQTTIDTADVVEMESPD